MGEPIFEYRISMVLNVSKLFGECEQTFNLLENISCIVQNLPLKHKNKGLVEKTNKIYELIKTEPFAVFGIRYALKEIKKRESLDSHVAKECKGYYIGIAKFVLRNITS